jgi:heptose-I-phosphate ethanolaminephosphotransferase
MSLSRVVEFVVLLVNLAMVTLIGLVFVAQDAGFYMLGAVLWIAGIYAGWQCHKSRTSIYLAPLLVCYYLILLFTALAEVLTVVGIIATTVLFVSAHTIARTPFRFRIPLSVVLLVIFAVQYAEIAYYQIFAAGIDASAIYAILQSNTDEGLDFLTATFTPGNLVVIVSLTIVTILSLSRCATASETKLRLYLSLAILPISVYFLPVSQQAKSGYQGYQQEIAAWKDARDMVDPVEFRSSSRWPEKQQTYLVVIGESATRTHFSAYGYPLETTPKLQADPNAILFTDFVATNSNTNTSLADMLTARTHGSELPVYRHPNIVDVANSAGFKTFWISNQRRMGVWDNVVSIIASYADVQTFINHYIGKGSETRMQDEFLLPELEEVLGNQRADKNLIFMHLSGSHAIYWDRYPDEFAYFNSDNSELDSYNNSIRYTDDLMEKVVRLADRYAVDAVVYFSDHGDDVEKGLGHNASAMTKPMIEIPFIVWFSDHYQEAQSAIVQEFIAAKDRPFLGDRVFHILLYLAGIEMEGTPASSMADYTNNDRMVRHEQDKYVDIPD